jgi:hypothetical protein
MRRSRFASCRGDWVWDDNRYCVEDFKRALGSDGDGYASCTGTVPNGPIKAPHDGIKGDAAPSKELLLKGIAGWSNKPGAYIDPSRPDEARTVDNRTPVVGVISSLKISAEPYLDDPDVMDALEAKFAEYDGDDAQYPAQNPTRAHHVRRREGPSRVDAPPRRRTRARPRLRDVSRDHHRGLRARANV